MNGMNGHAKEEEKIRVGYTRSGLSFVTIFSFFSEKLDTSKDSHL